MESGWSLHQVSILVEGDAAFGDGGVELGEGLEVLVDDRLVDQGPEGFGGLQFGRVSPAPDLIRGGASRPA